MDQKMFICGFILAVVFMRFPVTESIAAAEMSGVIYPGKGVDNILLGERPPSGTPCGRGAELEITCAAGRVEKIAVTSLRFSVERSGLHVGSPLGDIFRYYGDGKDKIVPGGILIQYPDQGIDFTVDKKLGQITAITIYRPLLPEFPTKGYGQFNKQLKQAP